MKELVAAAVQVAPEPGPLTAESIDRNVARAAELAARCVTSTGAELVVLPEAVTTGFTPGVDAATLWDLVDVVPGRLTAPFAVVAAEHGVHLVVGTYERGQPRAAVYNAAVLIGPSGAVSGHYRKTHLFGAEESWVHAGGEIDVARTPIGNIGFTICFDGDYPELSRVQAVLGAEIIVRPSAFLRSADIWELTTRARAYDNHVFVVAANATGRDAAGLVYFGNSLIVGPTAGVLARGTSQEGWVAARLDPAMMQQLSPGSSQPQHFDHLRDRNIALYLRYQEELLSPATAPFPHPDRSQSPGETSPTASPVTTTP